MCYTKEHEYFKKNYSIKEYLNEEKLKYNYKGREKYETADGTGCIKTEKHQL